VDPEHIVDGLVVAEVPITELVLTITDFVLQMVVLHVPSARKKYVVLDEGTGVWLIPVPRNVPPHDPEYHTHLAPVPKVPPFLLIDVADPIHIVDGEIDTESDVTEFVFNVIPVLTHAVVLQAPCART